MNFTKSNNQSPASQLTANWAAEPYKKFPDHRTRPAVELLSRVKLDIPEYIADLGCGAGNITRLMAERWPAAEFFGVDSSHDMLNVAASDSQDNMKWIPADVTQWCPEKPLDLLLTNSLLHLIPHEQLLPQLLSFIRPGGQLAMQVPDCFDDPWYQLMLDVLDDGGVAGKPIGTPDLKQQVANRLVMGKQQYYDLLAEQTSELDIWDTEYLQALEGPEPVFEWVSAAGLRPILSNLCETESAQFIASYRQRLKREYPQRTNGRTLFPFKRRFIVATVI